MSAAPSVANPGRDWEWHGSETEAGVDGNGLDALRAFAATQATDMLLVVRQGKVVLSLGEPDRKFLCHSMRKSILAALIGFEVEEGRIDLSATLENLGINDREGLSDIERQATVYDLLTARSGIYHPAGYETPWMRRIKEPRHSHAPGTFWCYNNWDFNALGTIFETLTGETVHQAFARRIAGPIGMQDFTHAGDEPDGWHESFDISEHRAYPFRMSSRDLARFGQLFLQRGLWSGTSVLPSGWAQQCVMPYSHAGTHGGYGYMWWLEREGVFLPSVVTPRGSYAAMGAGGHYCIVIPALDMVVVHRVDTEIQGREVTRFGMGKLLRLLLAAMNDTS
ncbi:MULTISPECIES: serine hydrolase domain-containing protein [unclassified Rhizobium]|uniref:serine hydrolase domain-containing protein n=1 Tax=unclassified Rhizobium TaxID=2613769 RepID=UPI001AE13B69|nr:MULTISPECIES: serine hydrolase domain-containing protein [unclassified Rhizobium]MBP2459810.1 CubicO group peptidase (beta-lactamase class C family) [Rhizobium sp. PvP014]MBP2531168.1 CubicO group peptidase (beta-lactamase class C family) [Rhizobium sp. PvP099]